MQNNESYSAKSRVVFLLLLSLAATLLFLGVIWDFVLTLILAAVFAALLYPIYRRLLSRVKGRKSVAAGLTVVLSIILVVVPMLLFFGLLAGQALEVQESATAWVTEQMSHSEEWQQQLEKSEILKKLVPYKDEILEKSGQLVRTAGTYMAEGVSAGLAGTMKGALMLFVMLSAMFAFLVDGPEILEAVLRYTPLSETDKTRMLNTYVSVGRATIKGTLIVGVVQGGLAGAAFWLAGIEGVAFWFVLMAVLSVLPGIGTALIWVPAVIYLYMKGQPGAALGVALWCALVVGTIDNVLRPILVGKETQMPDLMVMVTTLGGLAVFGFSGILLGPIIGALFMTVWALWGSAMAEGMRSPSPAAPVSADQ